MSKTNMQKLPIAVVERESGLAKDTLRVWERRYGFPVPERDSKGGRAYSHDQVEKLRLIKRLIDKGHRPAKIVSLPVEALTALLAPGASTPDLPGRGPELAVIEFLRASDLVGLRDHLSRLLANQGLIRFVVSDLSPLTVAVGQAWARGDITIAQEHLYTEVVQRILRGQLQHIANTTRSPRVLLATLPGEQHGLGLLMVEALLSANGANAISLGTEVPLDEIGTAANAHHCDAVALSFSRARTASFVGQGVRTLRQRLSPRIELWIGGEGAGWFRPAMNGVTHMNSFEALTSALSRWNPATR